MSRLIDADKLNKKLTEKALAQRNTPLVECRELIHDAPTVDAVEVVRCKDCEHHEELLYNNDGKVLCWVHGLDVVVDRNGYCNYGKRKEQEHEQAAEEEKD